MGPFGGSISQYMTTMRYLTALARSNGLRRQRSRMRTLLKKMTKASFYTNLRHRMIIIECRIYLILNWFAASAK